MEEIEYRINLYIKVAAVNRIKGYVKCRFRKIFSEYEAEVDRYLMKVKNKNDLKNS